MELIHVKMKNGEDLLGYLGVKTDTSVELITPISIMIDPHLGMFAKSWLIFSDLNAATITDTDYMFFSAASRKAVEYYEEFMHRLNEKDQHRQLEEDTEFTNELEDIFSAMMESRSTTKH
jgi:ABC-type taurine transport system ATPase subunit